MNQPAEPLQHHHIEQPGEHQEMENEIRENTVSDEEFELKEELRTKWINNFEKYIAMNITQREFMTKAKPLPQQKHLQIMDEILAEEIPKIEENREIDIWTLNVIYYSSVVTILGKKEELEKLRRQKPREVRWDGKQS